MVKRLDYYYQRAVEAPPFLRARGWNDFRDTKRPETTDPVVMATEALIYTSIDDSGAWQHYVDLIKATNAYLKESTGIHPSETDLRALRGLLTTLPVDVDAVRNWFARLYKRAERLRESSAD